MECQNARPREKQLVANLASHMDDYWAANWPRPMDDYWAAKLDRPSATCSENQMPLLRGCQNTCPREKNLDANLARSTEKHLVAKKARPMVDYWAANWHRPMVDYWAANLDRPSAICSERQKLSLRGCQNACPREQHLVAKKARPMDDY
jgi:hypothetical protein